jgi:SCF-associated factor 1
MQPLDQLQPTVLPALQNRSVISVHIGDYHYGALTSDGKLFTWGQYSKGALGLGDPRKIPVGEPGGYDNPALANQTHARGIPPPPDVTEPTLVKFAGDDGTRKFCFAAAAAGWHFGALVIDVSEVRIALMILWIREVCNLFNYLGLYPSRRSERRGGYCQHALSHF